MKDWCSGAQGGRWITVQIARNYNPVLLSRCPWQHPKSGQAYPRGLGAPDHRSRHTPILLSTSLILGFRLAEQQATQGQC